MEYIDFGSVCYVYSGYAFKKFNDNKEGKPVIKIGNIKVDGSIYKAECSYTNEVPLEKFNSQKDDLYIALSGATTGKVGVMDEEGYLINQRVGIIRRKDEGIPINYIKYFLDSITEKILKDAVGAAQPNISPNDILRYKFPVRTYEEMISISNFLTKIKYNIKICKKYIEYLETIVKSQFIEMFGFIEEQDRWDRKKWNEILSIKNGKDYKHILVETGGYPVYGTGGEIARASEYLCPENSIIVGRKGTINNPLLVKEKFWNVDTAFGIIPGDLLNYQYLYYFCKFFDFEKLNKAAVLPSTTKGDLLKIDINVPPIELQNEFASFVQQIDKSKYFGGVSYGIC